MAKSFKSDESFLEKIAIGAVGTKKVYDHLVNMGHKPVTLDRGSMSFKLWKAIKIKRLRVPDILCVNTGIKIESRAKTKLMISMSHSESDPERGWDFGLDDKDYIAFPVCEKSGDEPIDWTAFDLIQYVKVEELRKARQANKVIQEKPKGAQEGFETRLTWPCSIASYNGTISGLNDSHIQYKRESDNRKITLRLKRKDIILNALVQEGINVKKNEIICSVVPVYSTIPVETELDANYYLDLLKNPSLSSRYSAAKALCFYDHNVVQQPLIRLIQNESEHIYVKLEAAASLMKFNNQIGWSFVEQTLEGEYLENRLEAVIVLSEIDSEDSNKLLSKCLLDSNQHSEIRAGAAWALGELRNRNSLGSLLLSFKEMDESIKIEAARALAKLSERFQSDVMKKFPKVDPEERPGVAWAISKAGGFAINDILPLGIDKDARHWISYMIGTQNPENYVEEVAQLKNDDPEIYFAVNVLWKILTSWIHNLKEY
jgi:hypothetical protein